MGDPYQSNTHINAGPEVYMQNISDPCLLVHPGTISFLGKPQCCTSFISPWSCSDANMPIESAFGSGQGSSCALCVLTSCSSSVGRGVRSYRGVPTHIWGAHDLPPLQLFLLEPLYLVLTCSTPVISIFSDPVVEPSQTGPCQRHTVSYLET